jgi:hypothetical protein
LGDIVNALPTTLNIRFTHFLRVAEKLTVEGGGKETRKQDFRSLTKFSTGFPHIAVDGKHHILQGVSLIFHKFTAPITSAV